MPSFDGGRFATSASVLSNFQVPLTWTELLKRTARETQNDSGFGLAAELAYYFLQAVDANRRPSGNAEGLAGLIADSDHLLKRKVDPDVRDAWLIATAQRIEQVEISGYGTARTYADMLGFDRAARLLQETLEEEWATDEKLTRLARGFVNPQSIRSAPTHDA